MAVFGVGASVLGFFIWRLTRGRPTEGAVRLRPSGTARVQIQVPPGSYVIEIRDIEKQRSSVLEVALHLEGRLFVECPIGHRRKPP